MCVGGGVRKIMFIVGCCVFSSFLCACAFLFLLVWLFGYNFIWPFGPITIFFWENQPYLDETDRSAPSGASQLPYSAKNGLFIFSFSGFRARGGPFSELQGREGVCFLGFRGGTLGPVWGILAARGGAFSRGGPRWSPRRQF